MGLKEHPGLILGKVTSGQEDWVNTTGWIGYGIAMGLGIAAAMMYNSDKDKKVETERGSKTTVDVTK